MPPYSNGSLFDRALKQYAVVAAAVAAAVIVVADFVIN